MTVVARLKPQLKDRRQTPVLYQRSAHPQLTARDIDDKTIVDVTADDVVNKSGDVSS